MSLFSIETKGQLQPHDRQEWLLTNGLGGFASSTVIGCNIRRYHGLLCAAVVPPVGRIMALNRVGEILKLDGREDLLELSINQFRENLHPRGDKYLRRFELDGTARWEFEVENVKVIKELQLLWKQNVAVLRYTIEPAWPRPIQFSVLPFIALRDFHSLRRAQGTNFQTLPGARQMAVTDGKSTVYLASDAANFTEAHDWWYGHVYPIETERGQDDSEDLFCPGRFVVEGTSKMSVTFWAAMEPRPQPDWDFELQKRRDAFLSVCTHPEKPGEPSAVCTSTSVVIRKLARAANDFVVFRRAPDGSEGTSIIAGYPWFADWGRDTMISLPGLLLTPGRLEQAKQVLCIFAEYVSQGMIPNRFDDYTNEPHYNTVDASLWFIHAAFEYLKHSNDQAAFEQKLRPACRAILDGYRQGTRFNIRMDPADSLISQGDPTTQLTWMDAKCDGIAFTPRQGKAVEINALWYHALVLMGDQELAARVAESFRKVFWISPFRGLYDVVEGTRRDAALRPNQIFAVSLPNSPLNEDQQKAVVEIVRRELLTPVGLRTLARSDPNYHARYNGPQRQRDQAYHNGMVWPWLTGPFLDAYLRVNNHSAPAERQAREWLQPLIAQMDEFCIGQIHEICEADDPYRPVGCFAQAWSVAEVLRLAVELGM
ncbi:MAG TPA: amylo-alpha-1,6-glucosidase [Tepidisphaeraceae bacterium]|nr:amylo-alpha-1,6-glucosidase [Tepidisphaeraceae bacterium]